MKSYILKVIYAVIAILILESCGYQDHESLPALSTDQFQIKINKVKNNFFVVWPTRTDNLMDSEMLKLQQLFRVLSKANDADIKIVPIYKKNVLNKEKLRNRIFLIRNIIAGFGIPLNKIEMLDRIDSNKYEEGFAVSVVVYQIKVPNCSEFKDGGIRSLEESFKSFKCSTMSNFGKLIAYPSSLNKYKPTKNDKDSALKALDSILQGDR